MIPYWLLFAFCAAGALAYQNRGHLTRQGGLLLLSAAVAITLMIGLRWKVGGDWINYQGIYDDLSYLGFDDAISVVGADPAYGALNWISYQLGLGVWAVNLVCGTIFMWGLIRFARREPNPWLVLVVSVPYFIIVIGMGYTRQAVALGFIMAGLASLEGQRFLRYGVYIFFAAVFHKTAILTLPLVAAANISKNYLRSGVLLLACVVFYYFFLDASADRMITNYIDAEYQAEGALVRVAMNIPPAAVFLLARKRFGFSPMFEGIWRNYSLAALAALVLLYFFPGSAAVDRLGLYLIPLQLVILGRMPYAFPSKGKPSLIILLGVIAYSATVQFVWLNYAVYSDHWIPYQFYPLVEETF